MSCCAGTIAITDAALVAKLLNRLEQVLNTEIVQRIARHAAT